MLHLWSNPDLKFISNFYPHPILLDGKMWPTSEHYYQAHKSLDPLVQEQIRLLSTPGKAKRAGQALVLPEDWNQRKFLVMMKALLEKFKDPGLQAKLLSLSGTIVEDNKDLIWGSGVAGNLGPGHNMLGKTLMIVRDYYQKNIISPIDLTSPIPKPPHAGSFGINRKFDVHTGIDLYTPEGSEVKSMADGVVHKICDFTGVKAQCPWWEDTEALIIRHNFGFVLYGEIISHKKEGDVVKKGEVLGSVKRVLKKDKGLPMSMLHLEFYKGPVEDGVWWKLGEPCPDLLLNPILLFPEVL